MKLKYCAMISWQTQTQGEGSEKDQLQLRKSHGELVFQACNAIDVTLQSYWIADL